MIDFGIVEGIIYDFDGTIIYTESLHEEGWKYAGSIFDVEITPQMLIDQRGCSGKDAARLMLPNERHGEADDFRDAKASYVMEHLGDVAVHQGFIETYHVFNERGLVPWVCTSASMDFIEGVMRGVPDLRVLEGNIICKGMYERSKPYPDPLLVTFQKMSILPQRAVYVGDAHSDYVCAENAEAEFVYFCPANSVRDARIPIDVPHISDHKQLLDLLEEE